MLYGQDAQIPASILAQAVKESSQVPTTHQLLGEMQELLQVATQYVLCAQQHQVLYANKKRHDIQFKVGDQVLLSTSNLNLTSQVQRPSKKF